MNRQITRPSPTLPAVEPKLAAPARICDELSLMVAVTELIAWSTWSTVTCRGPSASQSMSWW